MAAAEREYRGIFENAVEGMFRSTPEGRYLLVNDALAKIYGYASPDDLIASVTNIGRQLYVDEAERAATLQQLNEHGVVSGLEVRARRKDGVGIWVSYSARAIRDDAGRLLYYDGNIMDITERKRADAMLRQNEKLAAMSTMVAGVAHELNNPLAVVLGQAHLLIDRVRDNQALTERAGKLVNAAERCARVVRNFLALARQRQPERRAVAVNSLVTEVLELLAYSLRLEGIVTKVDLDADVPELSADADQLSQVIINLVTNAMHAMRGLPAPRRLSIRTEYRTDSSRVLIVVADDGPGIPAEILPRIFEPFFTTKPTGEGTGLGLPLCRGFVEAHGGSLDVANAHGGGAVFTMTLPATAAAVVPEEPAVAATRRLRMLVVDDEPDVAETLADMLRMDGHDVDAVDSGRAGLAAIDAGHWDLIFTDVRMSDLDGPAFYEAAIRGHPELVGRFVFVTGDALSYETRRFLEGSEAVTVEKPFTMDAIRSAVRRIDV